MGENILSFLYEATKVLPKNDCGNFIRSHLLSKIHTIKDVNLPAQNFKPSVMCQTCGIELFDMPPKVSIKGPQKSNRLIRRILKMVENKKKLTIYQRGVLNSYHKNNQQIMRTVCKSCNNKTIRKFDKPKFVYVKQNKEDNKSKRSLKRKRLKDMYSGLNKEAVLSVLPTPQKVTKNNPKLNILKDKNSSKNVTENENYFISTTPTPLNNSPRSNFIRSKIGPPLRKLPDKNNQTKVKRNDLNNKNKVNKNKNRIQQGRIEKNEVLKKSEKKSNKESQIRTQLSSMLQNKQKSSSSLSEFLKSI